MTSPILENLAKARSKKTSGYKLKNPIDHWRKDPTSLRKSINAKCFDCSCNQIEEIRNCTVQSCPLWFVRPYQEDANG